MKGKTTTTFPKLRRWVVSMGLYGEEYFLETTRGKALANAWRSDVFSGTSFKDFIKVARARLSHIQPDPKPCTVGGCPALYYSHNSQYVQVLLEGKDFLVNAHPLDVLPENLRPKAYQSRVPA